MPSICMFEDRSTPVKTDLRGRMHSLLGPVLHGFPNVLKAP